MAGTITPKTKGKAKERSVDVQPARTKEGREGASPSRGKLLNYLHLAM
jgi:hypothetical protein